MRELGCGVTAHAWWLPPRPREAARQAYSTSPPSVGVPASMSGRGVAGPAGVSVTVCTGSRIWSGPIRGCCSSAPSGCVVLQANAAAPATHTAMSTARRMSPPYRVAV
ncbi:hypothetical protein A176_006220 [Myxococcus hansupus]|uniref:Uncharacterized protein n=1 Tax=Pseudomyxococcus hansupus TaxID=1297742 RepID=A0A0H4X5X8_9BACT|nr:hypothetical protein A176_006220 [Myxococcus hansupus]